MSITQSRWRKYIELSLPLSNIQFKQPWSKHMTEVLMGLAFSEKLKDVNLTSSHVAELRMKNQEPNKIVVLQDDQNFEATGEDQIFTIASMLECIKAAIFAVANKSDSVKYSIKKKDSSGNVYYFSGSVWNTGEVFFTAIKLFDAQVVTLCNVIAGYDSKNTLDLDAFESLKSIKWKLLNAIIVRGESKVRNLFKLYSKQNQPYWNIGVGLFSEIEKVGVNLITAELNRFKLIADPFIVKIGQETLVFAEVIEEKKGKIALFEFVDDALTFKKIILEEQFHLSFPQIFSHNNDYYMCPETSEKEEIRIYKAVHFPLEWKLDRILIKQIDAVDTLIIVEDDFLWLISCVNIGIVKGNYNTMWGFKYELDSINPITSMNCNPLSREYADVRNGGIILGENRIIRSAQQPKFGQYGAGLALREIKKISIAEYEEEEIMKLVGGFAHSHTANHHISGTEDVIAVDFVTQKPK